MFRRTGNSVLYFVKSGGVYGFEEQGLLRVVGGGETELPANAIEGRFTGRKRGLGSQSHTMQVQQRHSSLKVDTGVPPWIKSHVHQGWTTEGWSRALWPSYGRNIDSISNRVAKRYRL